ncbi:MAG: WbqC family protein, partial [Deltaproteobacteria bacterium]|nr:WbqC family protein [Deltaproteobacteria bacterium]
MSKRVAIVQSNYIPWKGYFDIINMVDEFIIYDDMQYTRRDWRNRNKIKTHQGANWLTIPVEVKGKYFQKIIETRISDPFWGKRHWASLIHNYSKAKFFNKYKAVFKALYFDNTEEFLSLINFNFITTINQVLGINTLLSWSTDYNSGEGKTGRLLNLCKETGATEYLSGPAAQGYLDEELFHRDGVEIRWMDYS